MRGIYFKVPDKVADDLRLLAEREGRTQTALVTDLLYGRLYSGAPTPCSLNVDGKLVSGSILHLAVVVGG